MQCKQKFFKCQYCGNMVGLIEDQGIPLVCCGEEMEELVPNTVDASNEKHVPVATVTGDSISVQVGSVPHPMEDGHHIAFVYLESECGGQRKCLKIGAEPSVTFCLTDDKPVAVYAYCNLHGLWRTEL